MPLVVTPPLDLDSLVTDRVFLVPARRAGESDEAPKPPAVVFCERLDNESFCAAVVRELGERYEVRPCGPGWPDERLEQVDLSGVRFYLELDAASGNFVRPTGLERLQVPKFAWLVDTHKKPDFHRQLARTMDLTFFAMRGWGHVLDGPTAWLPLHADGEVFRPVEQARDVDVCFVGSHAWRADPLERIAAKHELRLHVSCTTGPREKTRTAEVYARSKVVFNRHVTNDLNFRVFEALACGRALLTDAQHNGQYELFEEGRHYALYKDEADLERQLLRLLSDDVLRERLEREGAALARAQHTTRARVAQLVRGIETTLARRAPSAPPPPTRAVAVASPASPVVAEPPAAWTEALAIEAPSGPARRWLVLAGEAGPSADSRSYVERLASRLVAAGHDVTLARQRSSEALPPRPARPGEPAVVELSAGDLPRPRTEENQLLVAAGPLHRQVDRVAREHGPFDLVLAEGSLGQLVGPPLAMRLGRPLVLALTRCEVARRRDRLTRDQVYAAQLEQWACERAAAVVVAEASLAEPLLRHYKVKAPRAVVASPRPRDDAAGARLLLGRLGVAGPYALVVGHDVVDVDPAALLRARPGRAAVLSGTGVDVVRPDGARAQRSQSALSGPALTALARGAEVVLGVGSLDLAALDARALARSFAHARDATPSALAEALAAARPLTTVTPDAGRALATLGEELLGAATARPPREARAHVLR